jgi:hypothetical protein
MIGNGYNSSVFKVQESDEMKQVTRQLPEALLNLLSRGRPVLLLTIDAEGFPHSAYTWAVAPTAATVHFGLEYETTTMANLAQNPRASLHIMAEENLLYLIKGMPRQIKARLEAAPFKIALMALDITEVKNQTWPHVTVQPLAYLWRPEQREAMLALEQAIYAEMRAWEA